MSLYLSKKLITFVYLLGLIALANLLQAQSNREINYSIFSTNLESIPLEFINRQLASPLKPSIQNISLIQQDDSFNEFTSFSSTNKKSRWSITAAILVASFGTDVYLRNAAQKQRYHSLDWWLSRSNRLGELDLILKGMSIGLVSGFIVESPRLKQSSLNIARSYLISRVITDITKRSIGRARPFLDQGNLIFDPTKAAETSDYRAYVSGHTSAAWAFITPFAEEYSRWLYILPLSTAMARIYKDRHWASDVIAGSLVGFLAGYNTHHSDRFNLRFTGNGFKVFF